MKSHRIASVGIAALVLVVTALIAPAAWGQAQGLSAKPLLRATFSGDDTKEAVIITAEFAPGGTTGRHTHPGDEYTAREQSARAEGPSGPSSAGSLCLDPIKG